MNSAIAWLRKSTLLAGMLLLASCCATSKTHTVFPADRDEVETVHALRYAVATEDWEALDDLVVSRGAGEVDRAALIALVEQINAAIRASESGIHIVRDARRFEGPKQVVIELPNETTVLRVALERVEREGVDAWVVVWDNVTVPDI